MNKKPNNQASYRKYRFYSCTGAGITGAVRESNSGVLCSSYATDKYGTMARLIASELESNFGKTRVEAFHLLTQLNIMDLLKKHPLSLHDSPLNWAIGILTKSNDWEALQTYYAKKITSCL